MAFQASPDISGFSELWSARKIMGGAMMRAVVSSLAGLVLMSGIASAQQYPSRPVEMIIPFTAGSGLDVNGRTIASSLSKELKQPVIVINRDGAAGTIGFGALAS